MSYLIRFIKDGETIAAEEHYEHPPEDYLRRMVRALKADFADVCRTEL